MKKLWRIVLSVVVVASLACCAQETKHGGIGTSPSGPTSPQADDVQADDVDETATVEADAGLDAALATE
jgi:hypothetical protein